jgi:hypothetical protein
MNNLGVYQQLFSKVACLTLAVCIWHPLPLKAALEDTFRVLQIGTRAYTNVTVTTKARDYIFILHASGMTNIKVGDLPPDLRVKLGYLKQEQKAVNGAGAWARQTIKKLNASEMEQLQKRWCQLLPAGLNPKTLLTPQTLLLALATILAAYLFFCYCGMLICEKTGHKPGVMIWLPVLQVFPLLKAAGMSPWWFVALLLPGLNLLAHIVWSLKIAEARRKSLGAGILLILPLINIVAFLYLAFSNGASPKKEEPVIQVMTLETA